MSKTYDSTWIFLNWEGVEAENFETALRYFRMEDFGIPYSYSPLLVTSQSRAEANEEAYRAFVQASKRGFEYCVDQPEDAIALFKKYIPEKDSEIDLEKALKISSEAFGEDWGKMDLSLVSKFLDWIYSRGLEEKRLGVDQLVTNYYQ
jgi:ABC-type nitrate/sulfonate/bicarbonate transport system substrate-binding protein